MNQIKEQLTDRITTNIADALSTMPITDVSLQEKTETNEMVLQICRTAIQNGTSSIREALQLIEMLRIEFSQYED